MLVIDADEDRMIDLPGVGPCPRPVDIDQRITEFKRLKSLRIYRFQPGLGIHGDSEGDEVFILPLAGVFDVAISGAHPLQATAGGAVRAIYMTPQHSYLLTPQTPVVVAYARAGAVGRVPSQALRGAASQGLAEHLSYRFAALVPGTGLAVAGEALVHVIRGGIEAAGAVAAAGQTLAVPAGRAADLRAVGLAELLIIAV